MYGIAKTIEDLENLPGKSIVRSGNVACEKSEFVSGLWFLFGEQHAMEATDIVLPAVVLFNPEVTLREEYVVTWPGWDFPRPDVRPMAENEAKWYLQGSDDGTLMSRKVGPWTEAEK